MADQEYYFAGDHADTLIQGDKCIPIGSGDTFTLSQEDLNNSENSHMFEGEFPAIAVVPEPQPEVAVEDDTTTTPPKGGKK